MRKLLTAVLVVSLMTATVCVMAAPKPQKNFATHLTGAEEVPAVDTDAQGQLILKLNSDGTAMYFKLIVANIEDVLSAHIHLGDPGVNGPVLVPLYTAGPIPGPVQGVLAEGTFAVTPVLLEQIRSGETYANVHTSMYPGGEIRGQID